MTEFDGLFGGGPDHFCLDAMILIGWNNAGYLDLLGELVGPAFTADVITKLELGRSLKNHPQNRAILEADWLIEAPVRDEDTQLVADLHVLWESGPTQDMGEAEIVALSRRHGWTAITDDKKGRGALEEYRLEYAYGASLLIAAAACGERGLDAEAAWGIHREVEPGEAPHVGSKAKFIKCIEFARAVRERRGMVSWRELARDPYLDHIVDRADRRSPVRPRQRRE